MHTSKQSCSRYGLNISKYLQGKILNVMDGVSSVSIMFDEASDIQMHKHLNVFVNVSIFVCVVFLLVYIIFVGMHDSVLMPRLHVFTYMI